MDKESIDKMNSNIDDKLKQALCMTHDIQEIGGKILSELDKQRSHINSMRQKNDKINNDITKSNIVLHKIEKREKICIIM